MSTHRLPSEPVAPLVTLPLVLASTTLFLGALVPSLFVVVPKLLSGTGYDEQQIGFVMGAFSVASLVAMPALGRIIGRIGSAAAAPGRWPGAVVVSLALAVGAGGCIGFGHVDSVIGYAACRAAQGIGFAGALVGATAYVADIAPPGRLAQALGAVGVLTLGSQAVGPFAAEVLEASVGWQWVFRTGAGAAVVGALVVLALPHVARETPPDQSAGGVPSAWSALVASACAGIGFGAVWMFLADYADRAGVGGVSPFFVPYVAAAVIARVGLGHLADRLGHRAVSVPAMIVQAGALVWLAALDVRWQLVAIGGAFGLAHGINYPALQAMVVERSPSIPRSRAIAASTFSFGFGVALGALSLGAVAKAAGYPTMYAVAGGLALVGGGALAAAR